MSGVHEDALRKATGGNAEKLIDLALEEAFDEGYDEGCRGASELHDKDKLEGETKDALLARYYYLKHGGEWLVADVSEPEQYTAGFLDAMNLLGVKP